MSSWTYTFKELFQWANMQGKGWVRAIFGGAFTLVNLNVKFVELMTWVKSSR